MILDIIFIVFIVVFAVLGFVFGLFKTFVSFFGWFISFVLAYLCAKALANAFLTAKTAEWLVGDGSFFDTIYAIIPESIKNISMDTIRDRVNASDSEELIKYFIAENSGGLLSFFSSIIQNAVCKDIYLNSALVDVGQVLALELTYHLYVIMVGVIFFLVLRVIVMGVTIIFKVKDSKDGKEKQDVKLPLRFGGMALGAIRGLAYGCVVLVLMSYLSGVFTFLQGPVGNSKLSAPINTWISQTTGQKLSDDLEENESFLLVMSALEEKIATEEE
ncbi:MAG: CvpA family protein [Clostridia bacterium]|nr:CvpA family protein [Clostridia bacterium]